MLTSAQIRQSFLDFFREKQHTIVPSGSLMPDSPNLLFTNAGMNQFVPIFLGERAPDVDQWSGAVKGSKTRAADTQKCIRAGGKHNDLDDVGLDTYHHTFFEMLGNWSFGDYFKKEAIEWAWELVVGRWKFPAERIYATIYNPDKAIGDPAERDEEAWGFWAEKFRAAGLDPAVHIVNGNKKDNFWMMGETGPCGPCSELHVDLTPAGDTRGALVNSGDARCIEIWNLVFIQFNANPDGSFTPLPAQHVDTGMGFERVTSIIQGTKGFTDFANAKISNYETDIFRPIFDELERMSGKTYRATLPQGAQATAGAEKVTAEGDQVAVDPEKAAALGEKVTVDLHKVTVGAQQATAGAQNVAAGAEDVAVAPLQVTVDPQNVAAPLQQVTVDPQHVTARWADMPPGEPLANDNTQIAIDIAFRVIADHIRTLSFAIADGIQPGNNDRNYVLRRILRRAVKYGRTLGFKEPFFYKLVPVLAREMGEVFPELRARQKHIEETLKREEEAFNRTLDRGIELFQSEIARLNALPGSARFQRAQVGFQPAQSPTAPGAKYWKRNLPHYERPHGIYHVTISTRERRILSPEARTIVLSAFQHFDGKRYDLFAACAMPDHVHILFQPAIREQDGAGNPIFWSLSDLLHSVKSFTANEINKAEGQIGEMVWEKEYHDRLMRSDAEVEEKFLYLCRNPWTSGVVEEGEEYRWVWTWNDRARQDAAPSPLEAGAPGERLLREPPIAEQSTRERPLPAGMGRHPAGQSISGEFAFTLYDTYGFPLDLTELMARETGLTVDTAGFETHMQEQRARARAAQKKQVIELSEIETKEPTRFVGYDALSTPAKVLEVVSLKEKTAVILDCSTAYAEMGGQVGDTGEILSGADAFRVINTQKSGQTWLHFIEGADAPAVGTEVELTVEADRRRTIERHHSVTHLLHWALHEVVSKEATQKGSFVGPDKLTFDFNSAALTPAQVRDIERLVNERIVENVAVSWTEVPYAEVRGQHDIMQAFGDKYGEIVRVVQIGGQPTKLNGYSMELCAGTHVRGTGEIGLFRIHTEAAIAAGVRRIEASAGMLAYDAAVADSQRLQALAARLGTPTADLEKRLDSLLTQQKELEKALKSASQREAAARSKDLLAAAETIQGIPAIIANLGVADGETLQAVADALKGQFAGVIVLGGAANGAVTLIAAVSPDFTAKVQAGKLISAIAPLVGGKGGGKPDNARGGGKDPSQLDAALAHARSLIG